MNSDDTTLRMREELHIASGIHAGTRVALPARGADHVVCIGQSDANDILLADPCIAARHAELRSRTDGWDVLVHGDATDTRAQMLPARAWTPMPEALRLGDDVWIAIAPAGSDIPDATSWQQAVLRAPDESANPRAPDCPADASIETGRLPATLEPAASPVRSKAPFKPMLMACVTTALLLAPRLPLPLPVLRASPMPVTSSVKPPARVAPAQSHTPIAPAPLALVLSAPQWSGLRAIPRADGVFVVTGRVADRDSYDALAMQLSRLAPRPAMNVLTGEDINQVAAAALEAAPMLTATWDGDHTVTLSGVALDDAQLKRARERLDAALPCLTVVTGEIAFPDALVRQTDEALAALGVTRASARWDGEHIVLAGTPPPGQQPLVETAFRQLRASYRGRVDFVAHAATGDTRAADAALPFRIRAVVGGPNAYLVTIDGTIVTPGGVYDGWHLKAIAHDQIIFDSPRTLMVQR